VASYGNGICGEVKRTIQKSLKQIPRKRPRGQAWQTFLRTHAAEVWVCDCLQVSDLFFRPLVAFFLIAWRSGKVIQVHVTRSPTDPWVAHQLREATPYGQTPTELIRDTDRTCGHHCARVAATSDIKLLRTPSRTPRANAVGERFVGRVRRACLDHCLIFREKQLHRLLKAYVVYVNQARPQQGLGQRIADPLVPFAPLPNEPSKGMAVPVLGRLHDDFRRAV
jgi:putative transposase